MKKYLVLITVLSTIALAVGCTNPDNGTGSSDPSGTTPPDVTSSTAPSSSSSGAASGSMTTPTYADGTYRGAYVEGGESQVTVEFTLKDGKVDTIQFRDLSYGGTDYLADNADAATKAVAGQYQALIDAMEGKEIASEVEKLYKPEGVASDVEGFASATLRSGKIISAIRDGLNRGVYSMPK